MSEKQTLTSALLVVLLGASAIAQADPDAPPQPRDEARTDEPIDDAPPIERPSTIVDPDQLEPGEAIIPRPRDPPTPGPSGRFSVGVGIDPDDAFMASATVAQGDLFGTGKRLALNMQLSARHMLGLLRFEDPEVLGSDLRLRADLHAKRRRFPGFDRQAAGGELTLAHPFGKHLHGFVGYRLEQITVTAAPELATIARGAASEPRWRGGRLAALRGGLVYSTLDAPWLPSRGTSVGGSLEVADPRLGSELQFTRFDAWASHHRPLGPFTLHLGGTASSVFSRDPRGVPLSERLHFDGSREIRGFAPGAIGPSDPLTGMPLGGNLSYTLRGELELPVIPRYGLSIASFIDAGGLYGPGGAGGSGASMGFGVIWRSPIGPLRLDVAFPLGDDRPRFLFGLGF